MPSDNSLNTSMRSIRTEIALWVLAALALTVGFALVAANGAAHTVGLVLRVAGSLDDPHETVDVNALSQFLAQRAAAKAEDADKNDKNPKLRDLLRGLGLHP